MNVEAGRKHRSDQLDLSSQPQAWLPAVDDATERHLQAIPGVVECGLFIGYAPTVLVAR